MVPQPDIRPIQDGKYILRSTYNLRHGGYTFTICEGFVHDGASIPRFIWSLTGLRPDGLLRAGALIHDALYRSGGNLGLPEHSVAPFHSFTRKESDLIFHSLMAEAGVAPRRAYLAYLGVRLFGSFSFKAK